MKFEKHPKKVVMKVIYSDGSSDELELEGITYLKHEFTYNGIGLNSIPTFHMSLDSIKVIKYAKNEVSDL